MLINQLIYYEEINELCITIWPLEKSVIFASDSQISQKSVVNAKFCYQHNINKMAPIYKSKILNVIFLLPINITLDFLNYL